MTDNPYESPRETLSPQPRKSNAFKMFYVAFMIIATPFASAIGGFTLCSATFAVANAGTNNIDFSVSMAFLLGIIGAIGAAVGMIYLAVREWRRPELPPPTKPNLDFDFSKPSSDTYQPPVEPQPTDPPHSPET